MAQQEIVVVDMTGDAWEHEIEAAERRRRRCAYGVILLAVAVAFAVGYVAGLTGAS